MPREVRSTLTRQVIELAAVAACHSVCGMFSQLPHWYTPRDAEAGAARSPKASRAMTAAWSRVRE